MEWSGSLPVGCIMQQLVLLNRCNMQYGSIGMSRIWENSSSGNTYLGEKRGKPQAVSRQGAWVSRRGRRGRRERIWVLAVGHKFAEKCFS